MIMASARGVRKSAADAASPIIAFRLPSERLAPPALSCLPLQLGSVLSSVAARICDLFRLQWWYSGFI